MNNNDEEGTYSLTLWLDPELPDKLRDKPWVKDYDRMVVELENFLKQVCQTASECGERPSDESHRCVHD